VLDIPYIKELSAFACWLATVIAGHILYVSCTLILNHLDHS
jgi:hypothetical protein